MYRSLTILYCYTITVKINDNLLDTNEVNIVLLRKQKLYIINS